LQETAQEYRILQADYKHLIRVFAGEAPMGGLPEITQAISLLVSIIWDHYPIPPPEPLRWTKKPGPDAHKTALAKHLADTIPSDKFSVIF